MRVVTWLVGAGLLASATGCIEVNGLPNTSMGGYPSGYGYPGSTGYPGTSPSDTGYPNTGLPNAGMPNTGYPGAPLALGASFYDNGYAQGLLMIRVLRGDFEAVADKRAFRDLERTIIGVDLDRPQVGPVQQGDEMDRGRLVEPELLEQVVLDHARRHDVLQHVHVAALDLDVADEIDLERGGGPGVVDVAHDVDEAVVHFARDGAHQIRQKDRSPLQDAEEEDLALAGVFADLLAESLDALLDLVSAECLLHPRCSCHHAPNALHRVRWQTR